ncbi:tetratricopeptide repeat protein [bacterium]|nr:tetratricopeptide repeat protein [bacterium]MBU4561458.1 tetratricopeptide repeat protein [bacterium]MCG2676082.1 tetratricopeptide repeat protein [bacterium]MCG2677004.1 tetratricopeptide repeat protein [bacterium]
MRKSLILVSLLSLSLVLGCAGKRVKLEYKVKKGDVLRYKQITTGQIEFKITNRKPKITNLRRETYYTTKIEDIDDKGVAQASMTIEAVTEKEKNGEKTSEFFDFSNRPILMKITKQGETEVKNWEDCKAIFKELEMPSVVVQFSPTLPEKKVRVGSTWIDDEKMTYLFFDLSPIDIKLENKLMGFEKIAGDDCVKILTTEKTAIPIQKGKDSWYKAEVTIKDFNLNKEFTTYFAYDKGRPVNLEGKITGGEKRIYQRIKDGKEQSWETDVKKELSIVSTEVTAEEYKVWKEGVAKRKFKKSLYKTEAWRYYREGENYYREGKYDQAIASFKKALEQKPETPWVIAWIHVEMGGAYDKKGLKKEAKKEYECALKFAETVKEKDERLLRAIRRAQYALK